jgi:hypothetical protein
VIESNALVNLGLPENSSQQEINLILDTAIYNLSSAVTTPIQDDGSQVVGSPSALNFTGDAITVTDVGGVATINVSTLVPSSDYISNVELTGQNLVFTGTGNAFNSLIDLSPLNSTGFEAITEGVNTGLRIIGRNPDNYGNIGNNAVDASISLLSSTTRGATGQSSFASGTLTTASNTAATAMGSSTTARGASSFTANSGTDAVGTAATALNLSTFASGAWSLAVNDNTISSGIASFSAGSNTQAYSFAETSLGLWQTVYIQSQAGAWEALDRVFNVGNGTDNLNRRDAFTILKNGQTGIGIDNFEANTTGELLQVNGTVKATSFVGDSSGLTGLPSGSLLQNIVNPINAYYGTRLEPIADIAGYYVDSSNNKEVGYMAKASNSEVEARLHLINDTGNGVATFATFGSTYFSGNAGYNFLRNNALLESDNTLFISSTKNTAGGIQFLLGNKASYGIAPLESDYDKVLQLLPNKQILTPFLTTAVIDGEVTGKIPVTREWIEAQGFGGDPSFAEFLTSTGTRVGGDLVTIIGDYDNSNTGTKLNIIDDEGVTIENGYLAVNQWVLSGGVFNMFVDAPSITASRNIDFPDASGTIALTSDIPTLIDDDTFATATNLNIASAESIKAYVDANSGASKHIELLGDGTSLTYNINHAKGTRSLVFSLFNITTGKYDEGDYMYVDNNNTLVTFTTAPTLNQYEITII